MTDAPSRYKSLPPGRHLHRSLAPRRPLRCKLIYRCASRPLLRRSNWNLRPRPERPAPSTRTPTTTSAELKNSNPPPGDVSGHAVTSICVRTQTSARLPPHILPPHNAPRFLVCRRASREEEGSSSAARRPDQL